VLDPARGKLVEAMAISVLSTAVRRRKRIKCIASQTESQVTCGSSPDDGVVLLLFMLVVSDI
jgi:hypothetical protein